ncbi:MAG: OmpA family protein [Flavobacteriales bacterium]|nr:OmpA family protein [Flavobacteriales bacterium]MCB9193402.1 OmpA family protein [Flavobacteriales bacterium]
MRTLRLLLPLGWCIAAHGLFGQDPVRLTQDNGDCIGAIDITDSVYHQSDAVRGFGNTLEIRENPIDDKEWFEREHHTTWYRFRAPVTTTLTFDIIPDNPEDDIDFLLFEGAITDICDKIANKRVHPLRSNISRNDIALGSRCGLRKDAPDEYVRSGVGSSYSKAIDVQAGELFYLVIDYQDRPLAGYTIHFHYDPAPPPVEEHEEDKSDEQHLVIDVIDARSGTPIDADLTIDGMVFDKVVEAKGKDHYEYDMDMYRNLRIGCVRKGYMFYTTKVKGNTDPEVKVEVKLTPIQPGEHVVLEDIRFVGNDTKILRSSEAALLLLLRFLQENPKVKIMIEGHVNGPTFKNKKEFIELSTARAKSVYDFLLVNDIVPERLDFTGLGNSQMIYPEPKNKEQSEANRRVEIKVVSN